MKLMAEKLLQGTDTVIEIEGFLKKLALQRPLRIKLGVDPTRPDLTLGHMVGFLKLRQFQELGHTAILLIGDTTARIGDPSGRSETRPALSEQEITQNTQTYLDQVFKLLDPEHTHVRYNSEWLAPLRFDQVLDLTRRVTMARILERDDFAKRLAAKQPISMVECLYPLLQGYDSVVLQADVELGGSDQLFNLMMGRRLQEDFGQAPQVVMTVPLLIGLDGTRKMSKSYDNYIALSDSPSDIFGKLMSISDTLMWDYYRLLLGTPAATLEALKNEEHPLLAKKQLAQSITERLHGNPAALQARNAFESLFTNRETPADMPEFSLATLGATTLLEALYATQLFPSKAALRRLMDQGGLKLNGSPVNDPRLILDPQQAPYTLQAGKRTFLRISP